VWQPLTGIGITRPEAPPSWADDPPPEDVNLDTVREDLRVSLKEIQAELQRLRQSGEPGLRPRDVTEILTSQLRKVAVKLGDLDIENDGRIDGLRNAVGAHVRAWEDDAEQARRRRQVELSEKLEEVSSRARQWRDELVRVELRAEGAEAKLAKANDAVERWREENKRTKQALDDAEARLVAVEAELNGAPTRAFPAEAKMAEANAVAERWRGELALTRQQLVQTSTELDRVRAELNDVLAQADESLG
jgi:chromosome segregation ATPase